MVADITTITAVESDCRVYWQKIGWLPMSKENNKILYKGYSIR